MKISKLIEELNFIKEKWGDLPVFIPDDGFESEMDDRSFKVNNEESFINERHNKEIIRPERLTLS